MRLFVVLLWVLVLHQTLADIPDCDDLDTVELSASQRLPNGSYIYEGILIPERLTGEYDSRPLPDDSKESVNRRHWRGCVCKLKSCVRFCCRHDQIMKNGECTDTKEKELAQIDPYLNVTNANGLEVKRHFRTDLILQTDFHIPCSSSNLYPLDNRVEGNNYTLYENGTIHRHMDGVQMNKSEYCIQHNQLDDKDPQSRIVPHYCVQDEPKTAQTVVMIISLICMILTIGVYMCVKKLHRNLQGKSFICYMFCLFMGFLILLLDLWKLTDAICFTAGYLGYFFVMAAFFWLSVISFHLWKELGGNSSSHNRFLPNNLFLAFNGYAFGMAAILTLIIFILDAFVAKEDNLDWMPLVGYYTCWINAVDSSAMLYFYGPMLVLIAFNMTMFILTAIRIVAVKKELTKFAQRQERTKKLNSEKQTYIFFLRLFVIMGMSWSLEIISYLVRNNEFWKTVFTAADILNWSQGTVIFVLFVLKRSTLKHCMDRIRGRSKEAEAEASGEDISLEETQLAPSLL
nr:G-protein coupled receptor Mth isoform X2 [Drosophila kikkawai]XP_017027846.1 G-protein coupled receptor Mth isoform X2 [Drosophila kikkawai]